MILLEMNIVPQNKTKFELLFRLKQCQPTDSYRQVSHKAEDINLYKVVFRTQEVCGLQIQLTNFRQLLFSQLIVHELNLFMAPFGGQNIIWIFSNLRVSTFKKSMTGCPNRQLLPKIEVFHKPERTKEGPHQNEF